MDIHYIKLYHIQVDITKNRETQKQLNTKPVRIMYHSLIQFPPSHFPSHLLISFFFVIAGFMLCDLISDSDPVETIYVNGINKAPKSKLLT